MYKEHVIKMLSGTLDGHLKLKFRSPEYSDGIKHVRELVDQTFTRVIHPEELMEFCVSVICSVQPEDPRGNRHLSDLEHGILAAAYFLYTVVHPLEYSPA